MKKTISKSQVINYIKGHGTESLSGEWKATINGVRVGCCKRTIILYDEYYKFPSFDNVTLDDYELVFETKNATTSYDNSSRNNKIVDLYFKVIEGIMIGMGLIEGEEEKEKEEEKEENGLTIKINKGYKLKEVLEENVDCWGSWACHGYIDGITYTDEGYYYFSNYYGSEGGRYNEKWDQIIPYYDIYEMDEENFIEKYCMNKEEAENLEFVEEPLIRELQGLHVDNENGRYGPLVIRDGDGRNYKNGSGMYKFRNGLFYKVVLK